MFFAERITSINMGDLVLEVGPGSDPHPRSNILLEISASDLELKKQRGNTPPLVTDKKVVYYDGVKFPFKDKEFDYVICSHVLEHVKNVPLFCSELQRVSKRGYLEFPTIYYDYLYNFDVHLNFLNYVPSLNTIYSMKKSDTHLATFRSVQNLFYESLSKGYDDIVQQLKSFMFQGFEWDSDNFPKIENVSTIAQLTSDEKVLGHKSYIDEPAQPEAKDSSGQVATLAQEENFAPKSSLRDFLRRLV